MIKFFRRIRQKLLSQNKFSKYLLYAIGEIILVVIGILIALQINNWNEERKSADYTKLLFNKTLQELKFNLEKANKVVGYYRKKDSLYNKVINKRATKEDYIESSEYLFLITSGEFVLLSDDTFQKLINSEKQMTQEQDALLSNLKQLYSTSKAEVDLGDALLPKHIFGLSNKYKNEKTWYADLMNFGIRSEDMLNYFLNDPAYLNDATYYFVAFLGIHLNSIKEFREDAIKRYIELSDYLNVSIDTSIVKNLNYYNHYLGTYKGVSTSLQIKEQTNTLEYTRIRNSDSVKLESFPLYLDSKTYFTTPSSFGKLIYDKNNDVIEIALSFGGAKQSTWKKIN
jgi:hypothetical protein